MIENSIVAGAQDEYDRTMATPEQEAMLEATKIEFQRKLLSSPTAVSHHCDWDDLSVLVFEDDGFIGALFEVLHNHPETAMAKLVRAKAKRMADDLEAAGTTASWGQCRDQ